MLTIIIVGAGIAGATAAIGLARQGHQVTILERRTPDQLRGGAGVHFQPNGARALKRMGLYDRLAVLAAANDGFRAMRYDGTLLAHVDKKSEVVELYLPRAECAFTLCEMAMELGVTVRYGVLIEALDAAKPSLRVAGGEDILADLVIGADGVNSTVRTSLYPDYRPEIQAQCTFTASVSLAALNSDPLLTHLSRSQTFQFRMGDGRFTVGCYIPPAKHFDMQIVDVKFARDTTPELAKATAKHLTGPFPDPEWIRNRFGDFDAELQALIQAAGPWRYWRQAVCRDMPPWSNGAGTVVLIGDAAHTIVPFAGQGANMAVEDGAALSVLLTKDIHIKKLPQIAKSFESLRRPRVHKVGLRADCNSEFHCLPDGPAQEKRDYMFSNFTVDIDAIIADFDAHPLSLEYWKWENAYDVVAEATNLQQSLSLAANETTA